MLTSGLSPLPLFPYSRMVYHQSANYVDIGSCHELQFRHRAQRHSIELGIKSFSPLDCKNSYHYTSYLHGLHGATLHPLPGLHGAITTPLTWPLVLSLHPLPGPHGAITTPLTRPLVLLLHLLPPWCYHNTPSLYSIVLSLYPLPARSMSPKFWVTNQR